MGTQFHLVPSLLCLGTPTHVKSMSAILAFKPNQKIIINGTGGRLCGWLMNIAIPCGLLTMS